MIVLEEVSRDVLNFVVPEVDVLQVGERLDEVGGQFGEVTVAQMQFL